MILRGLKNAGVLEVLHERIGRRPAVYVFPQLIAISEGGGGSETLMTHKCCGVTYFDFHDSQQSLGVIHVPQRCVLQEAMK